MDFETIDPLFMKTLVRCHLLQREAREKFFHNRPIFKQILKAYKCERRIRDQIEASNSRKNTWLSIIRNDIVYAYRRRIYFKEQKIRLAKLVAQRCQGRIESPNDPEFNESNSTMSDMNL